MKLLWQDLRLLLLKKPQQIRKEEMSQIQNKSKFQKDNILLKNHSIKYREGNISSPEKSKTMKKASLHQMDQRLDQHKSLDKPDSK